MGDGVSRCGCLLNIKIDSAIADKAITILDTNEVEQLDGLDESRENLTIILSSKTRWS